MASRRGDQDQGNDGPLEVAGMTFAVIAVMIGLIWIVASNKIVFHTTPLLRAMGTPWGWVPLDIATEVAISIHRDARTFLSKPGDVGFFDFVSFLNRALAPVNVIAVLAFFAWYLRAVSRPRANIYRRFKDASGLMELLSRVFTGTAPILHIRKDIASGKDPLWARQRFPEEVLLQEKVHGKPLVTGDRSSPQKMEARPERIEEWFKGLPSMSAAAAAAQAPAAQGRRGPAKAASSQLGRQVVHLADMADRKMFASMPTQKDEVFADRFSDTGKVMFALLCARAFGGSAGIADSDRAMDQLNNSCRGARHGLPNLTVAQWLFDKYRANPTAHKMFAVHHWEYTYLYELFVQAKRRGKFTDSQFRWLKPANRTLWYVLNTVGRFTPHTESAAAFNHHAYERKVGKMGRLPLRLGPNNELEHVVFVKGAVDGLMQAWEAWRDGADENDDQWWQDRHLWLTPERAIMGTMVAEPAPGNTEAARQMDETSFDDSQSRARTQAEARKRKEENDELSGLFNE